MARPPVGGGWHVAARHRWFASKRFRIWRGKSLLGVALLAGLALLLPLAFTQGLDLRLPGLGKGDDWEGRGGQAGHYRFHGEVWKPKKVSEVAGVGGHTLSPGPKQGHPSGYRPLKRYEPQRAAWPKAGSATVNLVSGTQRSRAPTRP